MCANIQTIHTFEGPSMWLNNVDVDSVEMARSPSKMQLTSVVDIYLSSIQGASFLCPYRRASMIHTLA